jgi:hypothetical protein
MVHVSFVRLSPGQCPRDFLIGIIFQDTFFACPRRECRSNLPLRSG